MAKNVIKIMSIILIVIAITGILQIPCYAAGMSDVTENINFWKPEEDTDDTTFSSEIDGITSGVRIVGILVSVGTLMVIGIKYMLGSIEEKAQYKQKMMPWILGAIMIFAMTTVPTLIYEATKGLFE